MNVKEYIEKYPGIRDECMAERIWKEGEFWY